MNGLRTTPFPADPATLELLISGYALSNVVFTAVELKVFDALVNGSLSSEEVAARVGASVTGVERLLNVLVALSLLTRDEKGRYANSPIAESALLSSSVHHCAILHHQRHLAPLFARLSDAVRSGETQLSAWSFGVDDEETNRGTCYDRLRRSPEEYEIFARAISASSVGVGTTIAEQVDWRDVHTLLDLGGGDGQVACELAMRVPHVKVIIIDVPEACQLANERILSSRLVDRVRAIPGDIRDPGSLVQEPVDAVLLSAILADWPSPEQAKIMSAARQVLHDRGLILISETLLQPDGAGPLIPALLSLAMLLAFGAQSLKEADVVALLQKHGFSHVRTHLNNSQGTRDLIVGRVLSQSTRV